MTIQLVPAILREALPRAPQAVIDDLCNNQHRLAAVGALTTRTRLAVWLAQCEHETEGFSIPMLRESRAYSKQRALQVWPSRKSQILAIPGSSGEGFARPLLNAMYGGRMGNRPGTDDGWNYVGRGGPQVTGLGAYADLQRATGLPAVANPDVVGAYGNQSTVIAWFFDWKKMGPIIDGGGLNASTKVWNGGYIGLEDRKRRLAGNAAMVARMPELIEMTKKLPGNPPTPTPPKDVVDAATAGERKARKTGATTTAVGAANEGSKATTGQGLPAWATGAVVFVGVAIVAVAVIKMAQKKRAVIANWF